VISAYRGVNRPPPMPFQVARVWPSLSRGGGLAGWPSSPRDPFRYGFYKEMVTGPRGFEPLILRLRAACSTGLSYGPTSTGPPDFEPAT
jgi:hypothetical protein